MRPLRAHRPRPMRGGVQQQRRPAATGLGWAAGGADEEPRAVSDDEDEEYARDRVADAGWPHHGAGAVRTPAASSRRGRALLNAASGAVRCRISTPPNDAQIRLRTGKHARPAVCDGRSPGPRARGERGVRGLARRRAAALWARQLECGRSAGRRQPAPPSATSEAGVWPLASGPLACSSPLRPAQEPMRKGCTACHAPIRH